MPPWRTVLGVASALAVLAAGLVVFVPSGPHVGPTRRFDWRAAYRSIAAPGVRLGAGEERAAVS